MKTKKKMKKMNCISGRANAVLNILFILWCAMCVVPFLLVLGVSFSSESSLALYGYHVIPREFSLAAYEYVFNKSGMLLRAYTITIVSTVVGTVASTCITALYAYPVSRKSFKYRKIFSFIAFFTMIFSGGSVASYMVYTQILGLKDNYFVYIAPSLMSAWHMILLRTFMTSSVPDDLIDSAKIDGAGEGTVFSKIVIPLCKPGLATISLFTAIGLWNDWYTPSLYIKDTKMYNLQYTLYSTLTSLQYLKTNMDKVGGSAGLLLAEMPSEGIRMAMCIVTIGPIVLAYPFFQKYFVKGLTVGSVKG